MSRVDIVGLGRQTAGLGTKVTTMEYFPPAENFDKTQNRETLTIEETIGSRFPTGLEYGTRYFSLGLKASPRSSSGPRIKSAFLGQPTTVAGTAGDVGSFVHTFDPTLAGKTPEPHSIFAVNKDPNPAIVDLFWDVIGNDYEESYVPNAFVEGTYNFIALDLDDTQASPTATRDTSTRRKFSEVIVYVSLAGAGEVAVKCASASHSYNNNLDTDEAILGSRKLYALPPGNADSEVKFAPREALNSYYREALKADPTQTKIRIVAKGAAIGATTKFFQVETIVESCEFIDAPATIDGGNVLKMVEVTARARLDDTSGKFIRQIWTNDVATY